MDGGWLFLVIVLGAIAAASIWGWRTQDRPPGTSEEFVEPREPRTQDRPPRTVGEEPMEPVRLRERSTQDTPSRTRGEEGGVRKEEASLSEAIRSSGVVAGMITFLLLGIPLGLVGLWSGGGTIYGMLGIVSVTALAVGFAATLYALAYGPIEWGAPPTAAPDRQTPTVHKRRRPPIPRRVKDEVWDRDGGQCVECGSDYKIHFDHIIPYSWGGSDTVDNLQILCERCNLRKGNRHL